MLNPVFLFSDPQGSQQVSFSGFFRKELSNREEPHKLAHRAQSGQAPLSRTNPNASSLLGVQERLLGLNSLSLRIAFIALANSFTTNSALDYLFNKNDDNDRHLQLGLDHIKRLYKRKTTLPTGFDC